MLNAKNVPSKGGNFEAPPTLEPGTYPARLVQILNLGLQEQQPYQGNPKDPAMEIDLTYELLDEFLLDEEGNEIPDKPRHLSEKMAFHSLDSDLAKSTKRYFALDPELEHDGDWEALVGTPCMVQITVAEGKGKNAGKTFNNIGGVSSMRAKEAANAPELVNPTKIFDFYNPDMEIFKSIPEWKQDIIKKSLEFDGSDLQKLLEGDGPKTESSNNEIEIEPETNEEEEKEDW